MLRLRFLNAIGKSLIKFIPYRLSSESVNQQLIEMKKYTEKLEQQFKLIYYQLDRNSFVECIQKYPGYNCQQKLFLMYQICKNNKGYIRGIPYSFRNIIFEWIADFQNYDITQVSLILESFVKIQDFIKNNININFFRNSAERTKILKHLTKLLALYQNDLKETQLVKIYQILTCFHCYDLMIVVEEKLKLLKFGLSVIMQGIQYPLFLYEINYEVINLDFHAFARWLPSTKFCRLKFQHRFITFLLYDRYELSRYVYGYLPIIRLLSFLAHSQPRNWVIQNSLVNIEHEIQMFLQKSCYKQRDVIFIGTYFEQLLFTSKYFFDQCLEKFVKFVINKYIHKMEPSNDNKFIYIKKLCYQFPDILQTLTLPKTSKESYNYKKLYLLNQNQFIKDFNKIYYTYLRIRLHQKKLLQYILKYYEIDRFTGEEILEIKNLTFNQKYNQLAENIWNNPRTRQIKRILRQQIKNVMTSVTAIDEKFIFYLYLICENVEQIKELEQVFRKIKIGHEKSLYYISRFHHLEIHYLQFLYLQEQKYHNQILRLINFTTFVKYIYLNQKKISFMQHYIFNPQLETFYDYAYRTLYLRKLSYLFRGQPLLNAVSGNLNQLLDDRCDLIIRNIIKLAFETGNQNQLFKTFSQNRQKIKNNNLLIKILLGQKPQTEISQMITKISQSKNDKLEQQLCEIYLVFPQFIPIKHKLLLDQLLFKNMTEIEFYYLLILYLANKQTNNNTFEFLEKKFIESQYIKMLRLRQTDYILKKYKLKLANSQILKLIKRRQATLLEFTSIQDKFLIFERSLTDSTFQSSFNIVEEILNYIHKMQNDQINRFLELCMKHSYKLNQKQLLDITNHISQSKYTQNIYAYLLLYIICPNHTDIIIDIINKNCPTIPLEYELSMDLLKLLHYKKLNYMYSGIKWFSHQKSSKQLNKIYNFKFHGVKSQHQVTIYLYYSLESYEMALLDKVFKTYSILYKIVYNYEIKPTHYNLNIYLKPFNIQPELI